jgi:hypothetical protein
MFLRLPFCRQNQEKEWDYPPGIAELPEKIKSRILTSALTAVFNMQRGKGK